jgi:hydroxymethylbilane synthase
MGKPPNIRTIPLQSAQLRIGTRGSPLALVQAEEVRRRLSAAGGFAEADMAIVPIRTSGDRLKDRSLADAGGKGLFTRELDEALLAGGIDIAVHSAKDMPTWLPDGIVIAGCLERADVRDAFLSPKAARLTDLPAGAVVGTASPRRKALVLEVRPDLKVADMRGNVATRLRKLGDGDADATFLALAGLARLGLADKATSLLDPQDWLPAVGQGTIAIAARSGDSGILERVATINHGDTALALICERAYLDALGGSCNTPIGGFAHISGGVLWFRGIIVKPDGSAAHRVERKGAAGEGGRIGAEAGKELAARGGPDFFRD